MLENKSRKQKGGKKRKENPINLHLKSSLLHDSASQQPGSGLEFLRVLPPTRSLGGSRQGGHDGDRRGQVEQVQGDAEARQQEGEADAEEGPGPRQEQQHGVMDGGEEEARERQDQPEQRGGEPGVERQGRQEERRRRLTRRHRLEIGMENQHWRGKAGFLSLSYRW